MKIKLKKREQMAILLDGLRESINFREKMTDQLLAFGIDLDMDLVQNDPAFDASLRIARMYIQDDKLLRWWLYESSDDEGYSDELGDIWYLDTAADLIEFYKSRIKK